MSHMKVVCFILIIRTGTEETQRRCDTTTKATGMVCLSTAQLRCDVGVWIMKLAEGDWEQLVGETGKIHGNLFIEPFQSGQGHVSELGVFVKLHLHQHHLGESS